MRLNSAFKGMNHPTDIIVSIIIIIPSIIVSTPYLLLFQCFSYSSGFISWQKKPKQTKKRQEKTRSGYCIVTFTGASMNPETIFIMHINRCIILFHKEMVQQSDS